MTEPNPPQRDASAPEPGSPSAPSSNWRHMHIWHIQPVRDVLAIAAILGLVYLGYAASLATVPLLLAMSLAYLLEPLVQRATRNRAVSRPGAAIGIILLALVAVLVPLTLGVGFGVVQAARAGQQLASNADWLVKSVDRPGDAALNQRAPGPAWIRIRDFVIEQERLSGHASPEQRGESKGEPRGDSKAEAPADPNAEPPKQAAPPTTTDAEPVHRVHAAHSPEVSELTSMAVQWLRANSGAITKQAIQTGQGAFDALTRGAITLGMVVFQGLLTAFFFFFIVSGYGRVRTFWESLIPDRRKARAFELLRQMDRVISGFVRGRLTIAAILVVYYTLAYWVIGVPIPLVLGPLVGVLCLIPFASSVGVPLAMALLWLDGSGPAWQQAWWWILLAPPAIAVIGQTLDDYVLTPKIQGKTTGMDTPSILFASLTGGALAGVYGVIIAIPAAACIKILLKEVVWPQFSAWASGKTTDFLPLSKD